MGANPRQVQAPHLSTNQECGLPLLEKQNINVRKLCYKATELNISWATKHSLTAPIYQNRRQQVKHWFKSNSIVLEGIN